MLTDHVAAIGFARAGRRSRRAALAHLGGGLLAAGLVSLGPARALAAAQEEGGDILVAGPFVGEAPALDAFIAVLASAAEAGADQREVRAYLCDGNTINEWFTGVASGNTLELTSEGGARLEGVLTPGQAVGTLALSDGSAAVFEAPFATGGAAGLYDVTLSPDGAVNGSAAWGEARLEGRVVEELADGSHLVAGVITPEDGSQLAFATFASADAAGELRLLVLPNGRNKGGGKTGLGTGVIEQKTPARRR